jgi:hypothetical protein
MRHFIITGLVFFVLAALATLAVFLLIRFYPAPLSIEEVTTGIEAKVDESINATASLATNESTTTLDIPEQGIPLKTLSLEGAQKKAVEAVGINTETFVITKDMLQCARDTVGADRVSAFMAGEAPSVFEIAKLLPCLQASP